MHTEDQHKRPHINEVIDRLVKMNEVFAAEKEAEKSEGL